jgi:hypothetical protein
MPLWAPKARPHRSTADVAFKEMFIDSNLLATAPVSAKRPIVWHPASLVQ